VKYDISERSLNKRFDGVPGRFDAIAYGNTSSLFQGGRILIAVAIG
jgi:hypothetical protein